MKYFQTEFRQNRLCEKSEKWRTHSYFGQC
jgi:hypothetical protein